MLPAVLLGAMISSLFALPLALPLQASAHDLGLLALLGKKTVSKAKPMPDRAIAQAQQTIESIKS